MNRPPLRVADVFRAHWQEYRAVHPVAAHPARVVRHLLECRTAVLGGHLYRCDDCGREVPLYNSCRDRHCPTCQTLRKQQWLETRRAEILPVPYFHAVFTLPHMLNPLIDTNRARLLGELFAVVNWVLQHFAADPQWKLQGQLGFIAVLHTWTQKLLLHYHLHCLVPGGAWNGAAGRWTSAHGTFLFGKDALAKAFKARFIRRLQSLRRRGKLHGVGAATTLAAPAAWNAFIHELWAAKWVVYPKATGKRPEQALDYLARYTHKVALGDHRILKLHEGQVTFSW
ncbi:MAG: transposase [Candidatus Competibacteraceae bacterium]